MDEADSRNGNGDGELTEQERELLRKIQEQRAKLAEYWAAEEARQLSAIEEYTRKIEAQSYIWVHYHSRARVYMEMERYEEAVADLTRAIEIEDEDAPGYLYGARGAAYLGMERYEDAIEDLDEAIARDSDEWTSYYGDRGTAKLGLKRYEEAIADLTRALVYNAGDEDYYRARGAAYLALEMDAAADADFEKARELAEMSEWDWDLD